MGMAAAGKQDVTIRFEKDLLKVLDDYRADNGWSRAWLINKAIKEFIAKHIESEKQ